MSVLVKGMEMPADCDNCLFFEDDYYHPTCGLTEHSRGYKWNPRGQRMPDCPLIEVPADVQPVKHGKWVQDAVYVDETTGEPCLAWFCNQCGEPQMVGTNYCPNCGTKMDGET